MSSKDQLIQEINVMGYILTVQINELINVLHHQLLSQLDHYHFQHAVSPFRGKNRSQSFDFLQYFVPAIEYVVAMIRQSVPLDLTIQDLRTFTEVGLQRYYTRLHDQTQTNVELLEEVMTGMKFIYSFPYTSLAPEDLKGWVRHRCEEYEIPLPILIQS